MAISTYKVFLMHGTTSSQTTTYAKLVDIKDYPDLGGAPEGIDVTTLSDGSRHYVPGIEETDALEFTSNYDDADFQTLKALEGTKEKYSVWFGGTVSGGVATPTGSDGKFDFDGYLSVRVSGGGVNEAVNMAITILPASDITLSE